MSTLGKSPQFGIYQRMDAITGTSDSSYTLKINTVPQPNFIAEQLIVSVNGVIQAPNSAYTVNGSTITFSEALDSATHTIDFITAMGHAHSTNTVSDNSVTAAKLDSNDNAVVGGPITIDSGVSVVINGSLSIV